MPAELPGITDHDGTPARLLLIELRTRITSQKLHYRSGDEEAAVKSVYDLFVGARKLLTEHPQAEAFGAVTIFFLNQVLRPYTARWHRWVVDGRFTAESSRREFRKELKQLQRQIEPFLELLSLLTQGK